MRRLTPFLLAILLCLALVSCEPSDYPYYDMKRVALEGPWPYQHPPQTLTELLDRDVIIQGIIVDDAEAHPDSEETQVTVTITKVFQDNAKGLFFGKLQEGDTIKLVEPYYVTGDWFWKQLMVDDGIMPSAAGKEYVFFLQCIAPTDDPYYYTNGIFCRYPAIDAAGLSPKEITSKVDSMSIQDLYLRPNISNLENTMYRELYERVIWMYMQ